MSVQALAFDSPVTWASFNASDVVWRDGALRFPCKGTVDEWWSVVTRDTIDCAFIGELRLHTGGRELVLSDIGLAHGDGWTVVDSDGQVAKLGQSAHFKTLDDFAHIGPGHATGYSLERDTEYLAGADRVHFDSGRLDSTHAARHIPAQAAKHTLAHADSHLASRMTYHDNTLTLTGGGTVNVYDSVFIVTDSKVTEKQDPNNHIHPGLVLWTDLDNRLHFPVGRHGEFYVANWWRQRFTRSQTTFDDEPSKLNFAIVGDWKIRTPKYEFIVSDMGIAQGHKLEWNNWWFAGGSCKYIGAVNAGDNQQQIGCLAKDQHEKVWTLVFWRGGPGQKDNVIKLMNVTQAALVVPDPPMPALLAHKKVTWGNDGRPTLN